MKKDGDRLVAAAPPNIAGKLEVRGIGIVDIERVDNVPVALLVELTSDIQRLPDDSRERPILGVKLPLITIDAMTASAPSKVALALDRMGVKLSEPGAAARRACCSSPACRGRASPQPSMRWRTWVGTSSTTFPPTFSAQFVNGGGECRTVVGCGRHGRPQPRLRPGRPARLINSIDGVEPEILYLDCAERAS